MLLSYPTTAASILLGICLFSCSKSTDPEKTKPLFKEPASVLLASTFPGEVSGIADSYAQPGSLWMIEDGGNPAILQRVNHSGQLEAHVDLPTTNNRDWEDLAIGPGPESGKKYLYIAETGDNDFKYDEYAVYRFEEPAAGITSVEKVDKIRFTYSDKKAHNTIAMMVEPTTKDIILVTKEKPAQIFMLRYPYEAASMNIAEEIGTTKLETVTAADISPDGTEILLRTYTSLYYWKKNAGELPQNALKRTGESIPVVLEPQAEAVAFKKDNTGFYTLSENGGLPVQLRLYFYQRN